MTIGKSAAHIWKLLVIAAVAGCGSGREAWTGRADRNMAAGEYRAAIVDIRNLIRDDPGNARFRLQHSEALLRIGEADAAATELRKARDLGAPEPTVAPLLIEAHIGRGAFAEALAQASSPALAGLASASLPRLRGFALIGLERYVEARAELLKALERDPSDIRARLAFARTARELDGPAAMKRELDTAVRAAPQEFAVRMALGTWYLQDGNLPAAREEFALAVTLAPPAQRRLSEASGLVALGTAELAANDIQAAAATHERLKERAAGSAPELLLGARIAAKQGRFEDAQISLQRILSQSSKNRPAELLMGAVTFAQGKLGLSEMYLAAALSGDPSNLAARRLLVEVHLRQMKARQVLEAVDGGGRNLDPDLLSAAGRASVMTGNLQAAVGYFERSSKAAPTEALRLLDLAAAYIMANRPVDALRLIEQVPSVEEVIYRREFLRLAALTSAGRLPEVQRLARELAHSRPKDGSALLVSARGLFAAGDVAGAREMLDRLVALDPQDTSSWLALAAFESARGDLIEADRAFGEALSRNPRDLDAIVGKAQIALARGNRAEAIERLESARALSPEAIAPRIALARLHLQAREHDRVAGLLQELKARAADDIPVRLLEADVALAAHRPSDAISLLRKLVSDFPAQPRLHVELARALIFAGQAAEANRAAEQALRIDAGYWPALALATSTAIQDGNLDAATVVMARIRESQAPAGLVATLDGDLAVRRKAYAEAASHYAAARKVAPLGALAVKEYEALRAARDPDPRRPLREWLERSPRDGAVRFALAQDLQSDAAHAAAERQYDEILRESPHHAAALNNLAWLKLAAGNDSAALELAQRAYALAPGHAAIADTYGWVLARAGRPLEAVPILRAAYETSSNGEMRYHLAAALAAAGDRTEAREHLEAIVARNETPDHLGAARTLLQELRGSDRG